MERRTFLAGAGTGVVAALGVDAAAPRGPVRSVLGGPVVRREFTVYQPGTDGYEAAPEVNAPPTISFDADAGTVTVVGKLFVGSSTCDEAKLERVVYRADSNTFSVAVDGGSKRDGLLPVAGACSDDMSPDAYRLELALESGLPDAVLVVEGSGADLHTAAAKRPSGD